MAAALACDVASLLPAVRKLPAGAPLEALFDGVAAGPELCSLLWARKVRSVGELAFVPPWELRDWLLAPEEEAAAVVARAQAACAAAFVSAWDLALAAMPATSTATGTTTATGARGGREGVGTAALLSTEGAPQGTNTGAIVGGDGGLSGAFMEVAGPNGAGKTQLCLQLAAAVSLGGGDVFWLDTEGTFAAGRLLELLEASARQAKGGHDVEAVALAALGRIRHHACESLQEIHDIVAELLGHARAGRALPALLVVDSVAAVARHAREGATAGGGGGQALSVPRRQAALSALASLFKALVARREGERAPAPPGVVVTNQVMGDPTSGGTRVALGYVWHHAVGARFVLSHLPPWEQRGHGSKELSVGKCRYLHVEKSPCTPPYVVPFEIGPSGLTLAGSVVLL